MDGLIREWLAGRRDPFAWLVRSKGIGFEPVPLAIGHAGFGPAPGRCLQATRALLAECPELDPVVGFALPPKGHDRVPIEHVWATNAERELIDVSWQNGGTAYIGAVITRPLLRILWSDRD
jgi:hypothetical protein